MFKKFWDFFYYFFPIFKKNRSPEYTKIDEEYDYEIVYIKLSEINNYKFIMVQN